ncbi:hypothetical protein IRJ41_006500 [Triplophysa rosa]|uniref:Uncharacterized protein n=1 Tax=Triplophysa rosa TaxID=992332 RepID=A0A9W7TEE0_TRIRA|nr:hypothetical protein IRJ41_006500 [Triplophysa rosa]
MQVYVLPKQARTRSWDSVFLYPEPPDSCLIADHMQKKLLSASWDWTSECDVEDPLLHVPYHPPREA